MTGQTGYATQPQEAESGIRLTGIETMSKEGPKPTECSRKDCKSKHFRKGETVEQNLSARKAAVTTWWCQNNHPQQTETTMIPDDWDDYVYPGIWTI